MFKTYTYVIVEISSVYDTPNTDNNRSKIENRLVGVTFTYTFFRDRVGMLAAHNSIITCYNNMYIDTFFKFLQL